MHDYIGLLCMTEPSGRENSTFKMLDDAAMFIDPSQISNKQVKVLKRSMLMNLLEQLARKGSAGEAEIERLKLVYEDRIVALRVEQEKELSVQTGKLRTELDESRRQAEDLKKRLNQTQKEYAALQEECRALKLENQDLRARLEKASAELESVALLNERFADAEARAEKAQKKIDEYDRIMRMDGRKALADVAEKLAKASEKLGEMEIAEDPFDAILPFDFDAFHSARNQTRERLAAVEARIEATPDVPQSIYAPAREIRMAYDELEARGDEGEERYKALATEMLNNQGSGECFMQMLLNDRTLIMLAQKLKTIDVAVELAKTSLKMG
jgi:chromosome segregation ATPase